MKAVFAIISVAPAIIEVRRAGMRQSRGVCSTALMRSDGQPVYIAERSILYMIYYWGQAHASTILCQ